MKRLWSPPRSASCLAKGALIAGGCPRPVAIDLIALVVEQARLHAKERLGGRSRLERCGTGSGVSMCAPVSVCHQVSTIGQRSSPTTR